MPNARLRKFGDSENNQGQRLHRSAPDPGSGCWELDNWYPLSEREERLFTNDMKDELRTDGDPIAWRAWSTAQAQL